MAKKRKASRVAEAPSGPREYDSKDARLGPINTFEDIADEQEEYFLDKDKILLGDEKGTKRQRREQEEDDFLDLSDDEVLGADSDDSDNEENQQDPSDRRKQKKKAKKAAAKTKKAKAAAVQDSDDDDETPKKAGNEEEEGDQGWWGTSKEEYYDGETIETEANALEEEVEARRLQKKQLSRMKASDFFDVDEWTEKKTTDTKTATDSAAPVKLATKTNKEEIDSMTPDEKAKYLKDYYPEFDPLCDDFVELEPLMNEYKALAEGKPSESLEVVQFRALSCYVATICMYLSLFMSPSRDNPTGPRYIMDADELHDHEVMQYLVDTRATWERVKKVQARRAAKAKKAAASAASAALAVERAIEAKAAQEAEEKAAKAEKKSKKAKKAVDADSLSTKKKAKKDKKAQALEESMADLSELLNKKPKKASKKAAAAVSRADDSDNESGLSDLGEEEALDARTAEEKLKRKKSLGYYTSQIMQKSNLRTGASGNAGGDADIPYRERFRDRQARLEAAAMRRGQAPIEPGEELGGSDDEGSGDDNGGDEADLAYYDSIVKAHDAKMDVKAARKAAIEAGKLDRVLPETSLDKDGRRQLTWEIEKNKGLSHKTLKEKKNNPRVKKRVKFEKKKKQLASMRAVYKDVDRDNYKGERTGISTGLIRSIKLD